MRRSVLAAELAVVPGDDPIHVDDHAHPLGAGALQEGLHSLGPLAEVALEHDGEDLRSGPIEERKAKLARLIGGCDGIWPVEHIEEDGALVFAHARRLGLEGIVSKRKGSWSESATAWQDVN